MISGLQIYDSTFTQLPNEFIGQIPNSATVYCVGGPGQGNLKLLLDNPAQFGVPNSVLQDLSSDSGVTLTFSDGQVRWLQFRVQIPLLKRGHSFNHDTYN